MIIGNIPNDDYYFNNLLDFLVKRDDVLFTEYQIESLTNDNNLFFLINEAIPNENYYHILKQFLNLLDKYNNDDDYKMYKGKKIIQNGNNIKDETDKEIKIIMKYQKLLLTMFGGSYNESTKETHIIASKEIIQTIELNLKLLEELEAIKNNESEVKLKLLKWEHYRKPTMPVTQQDIKDFLQEIEAHYNINFQAKDKDALYKSLFTPKVD